MIRTIQVDPTHDGWIPMTLPVAVDENSRNSTRRLSAANKYKSWNRPKSTPTSLRSAPSGAFVENGATSQTANRPKTAIGATRSDCDRVSQLEHEATRKHNLETHLPIRKHKPPPWQKQLDGPTVPYVTTPSYTISRNKSKVSMTIKTGDFFDPEPEQRTVRRLNPYAERDSLMSQLQTQIEDLTLFLEEERLNHKETKRKATDQLKDKLDELTNLHENQIKIIQQQHEEEITKLREGQEQEMTEHTNKSESTIAQLRGDVEFYQGAFESYKSQLHQEIEDKWKKKEDELSTQHQEEIQKKIHDVRTRIVTEKNSEKSELQREHQRDLQNIRREHKRELDSLTRRFSSAAADLEKLKETEARLKECEQELSELHLNYDGVCQQLADVTRELTDSKVKLISYEQHFQDKVDEVDNKYKAQIDDLMVQNAEIRRLYMKKCGELYDEKSISDNVQTQRLDSAKKTMKEATVEKEYKNYLQELRQHRTESAKSSFSKPLTKFEKSDYVYVKVAKSCPVLPHNSGTGNQLVQRNEMQRPPIGRFSTDSFDVEKVASSEEGGSVQNTQITAQFPTDGATRGRPVSANSRMSTTSLSSLDTLALTELEIWSEIDRRLTEEARGEDADISKYFLEEFYL